MITRDTRLPPDILGRIQHVLSISGVHDLRPLLRAAMNAKLGLDLPEARAESPSLLEPLEGVPVTAWVGGAERPEFLRQSRLIVENWAGFEVPLRHVVEEARHHFDVCAALTAPDSPLTRCWLETAAGGE
jgi:hypothetical protein